MKYNNIFIVGIGRVADKCLAIASSFFNQHVQKISFTDSFKADSFFNKLENSLIISANNFYIFKEEAIDKNTIINYHNSLLPRHRGAGAHIWSVYENDFESGITWHLVDNGIDTGDIIVQEKIILDDNITSGKLLYKQHELAISSFELCLHKLQSNDFISNNWDSNMLSSIHKKKDIPNNGILDLTWDKKKISSFLRSMNIGIFKTIPLPQIILFSNKYEIISYEITNNSIVLNLYNQNNIKITIDNL
ncbi:formyltransferase domain-containing protein [Campylobacter pinnipediorum subsp. caledonicus]|uniref:Formyltransferase domain-containing protein n=1 Tax=Campylobacter pinnipediorum subsp. caledonicus TaxID=1874362 RepID=A0A1S6U9Q6_9BACT|nr:formyltransferase family protein [Campylobacter pinnipediorum]AQW86804.1 formyltransferase domain-containing protein [Campylobacter pinnipediorum subsp. caledonicus]AQW88458.1 formyltransferase domain-containing protein [Campylobacter pinnipediorum subsp. caledonicus]OPA72577.1 hypothetical protein BB381_05095 [Campylobacter pinnipediorum subsp. caledonicus]